MTEFDQDDVNAKNDESLRMLARSLTLSQGQFSLILARCNYRSLRQHLMQQLRERCPIEFRERVLDPSAKTIETTIQEELRDEPPPAVIISGLESVRDLDAVLLATNQARDEFRKNFPFPLVLWGTDEVLRRFIRVAPDFESWAATPIEFEIATDELIHFIQETADEVFAKVLDTGAGIFLDNAALNLGTGSPRRAELESARHELQSRDVKLDPELEASLEFVLGRDADASVEQSRQHYERSLALWQNSSNLERRGYVLYSLGIWWRTYATRHRAEDEQACGQAKDYFQQCVEVFEQANRKDLLAKFINALGVTLQQLQQWDELEEVATKALTLHQTYHDSFRLARTYGFLSEVALAKSAWTEAKQLAEQALSTLASAELSPSNSVSSEQSANLEWVRSYHQGWYLFSLARSLRHASLTLSSLGQQQEAIATLETATAETKPYYDPELYIRMLEEMRSLYFEQGAYLKAFEIKQERRSIEQQYGFRAFVGAGRLQPKQQVINPALAPVEAQRAPTQEITVSGRQQDVNRLVERIGRNDHKLTVIQGQSGVGKSSILQAGLIPALKQKAIGTRNVLPVLQQVYPDWIRVLGQCLAEALMEAGNFPSSPATLDSTATIFDQLRNSAENNLLIVIIFDQFEEFFFVCKEPSQRRAFYECLRECLDIPYVKVILSLREDYLYYLLECNNRLIRLEVINNNILDKNILYYLGNFSVDDAKSVIQSLTEPTHFSLEPSLIDALVQDLAGELGEVRPIELQVVGAQLQTEKITKLEQYREHGPKEKLVGRFLEEVVKDCGPGNEQIAKLVLYLLTDENNTRPLKTRGDLELELDVPAEKLDLVLEIFVKSRLVFQVPALPVDRYQLVHDYLVAFVRQQQSARLIAELEKEREQRKLTEAKLNQVLKQQLRSARRATFTLTGLLVAIGVLAVLATLIGINTYLTALSLSSVQNKELDRVVSALRAGRQLKQLSIAAIPETQFRVVTELSQAVYGVKELNRFERHSDVVTSVSFSPNGQILASASKDKTVKLWSIDGTLLKSLEGVKGHTGSVTSVRFSPNGQMLASTSEDKTVKLWSIDGTLLKTLKGHTGIVTGITFSPNGQMLASASEDKTVKLWSIDGTLLKTLKRHTGIVTGISFSPNGQMLASSSKYDPVKLWSLSGREIRSINNYGIIDISFRADSQTIVLTNKNGIRKLYDLNGTLLKNYSVDSRYAEPNLVSISISPDGKRLAYVESQEENKAKVNVGIGSWYQQENFVVEHKKKLTDLCFSPNGKLLASASEDNTVKLWSIDSKPSHFTQNNNSITSLRFSPDGKGIITASEDNTVKIWSNNGTFIRNLHRYHSQPNFSADGKTIITASVDNIVKILTPEGKEIQLLSEPRGSVTDISFSPDSKIIATTNADKTISLWRNNGTLIGTLKGHTDRVTSVTFSPDSKVIASIGDDKVVKLWSSDGALIKTLDGHVDGVKSVTFSFDSKVIATIGNDNVAKLWSWDGILIKTLDGHIDGASEIVFSPDSKLIASFGNDNIVKLWNSNGTLIKTLTEHTDSVTQVIFSPDTSIVASLNGSSGYYTAGNTTIKLWRTDGTLLKSIDNYGVQNIVFSPDGSMIASINTDNTVKLWSLNGTLRTTLRGHTGAVTSVSFSPDGKLVASASADNTVKLWSSDGNELKTLRGHDERVESVNFSTNGKIITSVSTSYNNERATSTVKLWSRDGNELNSIQANRLGFSADGKTITSSFSLNSNSNYRVKFWSEAGRELKEFQGKGESVSYFSNDGKTVALATDKNYDLKLWSLDNNLLATIKDPSDVNSVSFSPDRRLVASAGDDNTVKLWSRDGTLLKIMKGHSDKVNSVSFSPDSKTIASASDDKTVKLWSKNGTLIKTLKAHTEKVHTIVFSPDSKTIASASYDNTVKLWSKNGTLIKNIGEMIYDANKLSFSPDSKMLALVTSTENSRGNILKLYILNNSIWLKDTQLDTKKPLSSISFSPEGKAIAVTSNDQVSVLSLDLDEVLERGCNQVRDYLKNNPKAEKSDRHLCDDILPKK